MKKIILLAFVALGCNTITKEESEVITRKFLEDYAFKNKCDVYFRELQVISIKATDSKTLDSAEIAYRNTLAWVLNEKIRKDRIIVKSIDQFPSDFENLTHVYRTKAELSQHLKELNENYDYAIKTNNEELAKIKSRNDKNELFFAKVLLASESKCFTEPKKYYDTLNIFIDKNKKIVSPEYMYAGLLYGVSLNEAVKHVKTLPF